MKKYGFFIFVAVVAFAMVFGACNGVKYSDEWSNDETDHWHAAVGDETLIKDKAPHVDADNDGTCDVCNRSLKHVHDFSGEWKIDGTYHQRKCKNCTEYSEKEEHDYEEKQLTAPQCTKKGLMRYTCKICEYVKEQNIPALGHNFVDGVCTECGKTEEEASKVELGSYPQSKVDDSGTLMQLNAQAGTPKTDADKWSDSGYKLTIKGEVRSFMWFIDLDLGGERYRGVFYDSYRPSMMDEREEEVGAQESYQGSNGYEINKVHWFIFEPIVWRTLYTNEGISFVMSDLMLDAHEYNDAMVTVDGVFANNYKESSVRKWLNDDFLSATFTEDELSAIIDTTVDNGEKSTYIGGKTKANKYECENTKDKLFLLSSSEATNGDYGFSAVNDSKGDKAKCLTLTDYAKCQGAYFDKTTGVGWFLLRSPSADADSNSAYVGADGVVYGGDFVTSVGGIVPALNVDVTEL